MAQLLALAYVMILPKDFNYQITPGLMAHEFECKCERDECHYTLISQKLIFSYIDLRLSINMPLKINSGHRCQAHNAFVQGEEHSSHTTGHAIDISMDGMTQREKNLFLQYARKYFDYVKVYDDFLHCQINVERG